MCGILIPTYLAEQLAKEQAQKDHPQSNDTPNCHQEECGTCQGCSPSGIILDTDINRALIMNKMNR